ncbi:MAG: nitroreductase family protein [Acidobacteriota bacterium]|jgi:nitroreductase|nr:nitroreductase family protein [Acidobacteriota bacterium]
MPEVFMLIDSIVKRRSIRRYRQEPLDPEKLQRILEAARLAPTAKNRQDWKMVVVNDPVQRDALVEAAAPHQPFMRQAAVILAVCALNPEYVMRCGIPAYPVDLAIVLDHVSLQAAREGLGTCWIGSFNQEPARRVLAVPDPIVIVQLMTLGIPDEDPPPAPRKPLQDLVCFNNWESR